MPVDVGPCTGERKNLILWNHRWEEDKAPEAFFRVMGQLDRRGLDFGIMVLGQSFATQPACFAEAAERLGRRIAHWGYIPQRAAYLREVARCRFIVSTARHEFYGLAVREAIALGCYPLLPRRVVYPELVGDHPEHLYDSEQELADRLAVLLEGPPPAVSGDLRARITALTPAGVAARWDAWFDELA